MNQEEQYSFSPLDSYQWIKKEAFAYIKAQQWIDEALFEDFLNAFEDYFFTEQFSYTNSLPSRYAITAIEETEVLKIHKQQMHSLLQNSYEWQQFFIQNEQQTILRLMETIELFQRQSAKKRYEALFSFPAFIQKVKQKDLATMLGMTKYSISRLKSYK